MTENSNIFNDSYSSIPTVEDCYRIMREYDMLPNIVEHSRQVMRVSLAIVDNLRNPEAVNRELIIAASLLHDIAKTRAIETGERHDDTGGEMVREMGFPEIGYIVEQHIFFENFDPDGPLEEREIVYYADKCVMHDRIVTLDERVNDLIDRYGTTPQKQDGILNNKKIAAEIEEKINRFMIDDIRRVVLSLKDQSSREED